MLLVFMDLYKVGSFQCTPLFAQYYLVPLKTAVLSL
jgi:hypothetical protein